MNVAKYNWYMYIYKFTFFYWIKDELAFGLDFSYKLLIFKKKLKIQKTFQQENDQNVEGPKTLHIGEF